MSDDDHDALGARLDQALHSGLETNQVDVVALVAGSRGRARQLRVQRAAALALAAALVVGVPVGLQLSRSPGAGALPAVLLPSSAQYADQSAEPTRPGSAPGATGGQGTGTIPDAFAFTAEELPAGLAVLESAFSVVQPALVGGQLCSQELTAPVNDQGIVAGRRWQWGSAETDGELDITLTITAWSPDRVAAIFATATATATADRCRWSQPQAKATLTRVSGERVWAATSEGTGQYYARAVLRNDTTIVGIQVAHPQSRVQALALADELAAIQLQRLERIPAVTPS